MSTSAQSDVSIVVISYQGRDFLPPCLNALAQQEGPTPEILVVDNGSTDGSSALVRERFPGVRLLTLERNVGFAGGNNAGARVARGRYLAFLNNDTEAAPSWVETLRQALDAHPWAAMATSRIVYRHDPTILDSAGDGLTRWGGAFKRGHGRSAADEGEIREVFGACGAAFMIRREVFDQVGGFDEDFFFCHEDVDLSYRVQLRGHGCVYLPAATVLHVGSATMGRVSPRAVYYGQRNLEWLYLKNTPWPLLVRTLPGHLFYNLAACAYFCAVGLPGTFLRAKWHAFSGLPGVWRKRRLIQAAARVPAGRIWKLMEPGWLGLKWREKRFDLQIAKVSGDARSRRA